MIILVTGLPGNGKTLFAVSRGSKLLERPDRTIYYHGIQDLTLPWEPCDPETWYSLPVGSAVVIDEAQKCFRPLPPGAPRPKSITELETHRHKGFDLLLITQHPNLIDSHVRRLVGKHFHVHRTFGLNSTQVWEWEKCANPDDYFEKKLAVLSRMSFDKADFTKYKSAEVHTVKRKLPWKLFALPVGLVVVGALAFLGWSTLKGSVDPRSDAKSQQLPNTPLPPAMIPVQDHAKKASHRIEMTQPVIPDLPHTAPRYEALTAAVAVPVAQACMANFANNKIDCWCVSQRGSRIATTLKFCLEFIQYGRPFYDHEPDRSNSPGESMPSITAPKGDGLMRPAQPAPALSPLQAG